MSRSIEKGRETRFHFERVSNFDYCLLVFSLMNIALSILYSDAAYFGKEKFATFCLYFMFGTLFVEVSITIIRYMAQVELEKSQKILDMEETIFTSGKGSALFLEVFILLLQPYPFFADTTIKMIDNYNGFTFDYKFNYILVFLGFGKLFIILRVILTGTVYMSPRCKHFLIKRVDFAACTDARPTTSTQSSVSSRIHPCCSSGLSSFAVSLSSLSP